MGKGVRAKHLKPCAILVNQVESLVCGECGTLRERPVAAFLENEGAAGK